MAQIVADKAHSRGISLIQPSPEGKEQGPAKMPKLRAQAGKQPRGKKFPELVKEFKEIVDREVSEQDVELLGLKQKVQG